MQHVLWLLLLLCSLGADAVPVGRHSSSSPQPSGEITALPLDDVTDDVTDSSPTAGDHRASQHESASSSNISSSSESSGATVEVTSGRLRLLESVEAEREGAATADSSSDDTESAQGGEEQTEEGLDAMFESILENVNDIGEEESLLTEGNENEAEAEGLEATQDDTESDMKQAILASSGRSDTNSQATTKLTILTTKLDDPSSTTTPAENSTPRETMASTVSHTVTPPPPSSPKTSTTAHPRQRVTPTMTARREVETTTKKHRDWINWAGTIG